MLRRLARRFVDGWRAGLSPRALGLALCAAPLAAQAPRPAVIDLRGADLSTSIATLDGVWALHWKRLLTHADSASVTALVPFPRRWAETVVNGAPLPAIGYATYTVTVLLPPHTGRLALGVPTAYTSQRLYVNDTLVASSGRPDSTAAGAEPQWLDQVVTLDAHTDTLHLALQVANYWHSKGGPYRAMRIGSERMLRSERAVDTAMAWILGGCLFTGGLFFLGLYVFGNRDRATLYFALFCLAYSYRVVGTSLYVLHAAFPDLPWRLTVHIEYLSLFLSIAAFALYTKHLFPDDGYRPAIHAIAGLCLSLAGVVVLFPPSVFTRLINPFLLVMFVVIAYAFVVYIRAVRHRRLGARVALASTGVLLLVFIIINLQYFGLIEPSEVALTSGYFAFFVLQSLILSFRFAHTMTSARQQAEEGLRIKSEFLATMSHEIRTPLNAVLGLTNLLLAEKPRPDQKERLDVLQYSASNLLAIVNDVLDYSKIEEGQVSFEAVELDLAGALARIVEGQRSAADAKNIRLELSSDAPSELRVLGDPTRFAQVVNNLVSNAIKFTEHGGVTVWLRVRDRDAREVTVQIGVRDTGIGIAPDKQSLIFERFRQADASTSRRFGGTGLGLAICRRLLALQGVTLELESTPGVGSEFRFTQSFRVATPSGELPAQTPEQTTVARPPLEGRAVLLVEDNEVNVLVARALLRNWGAHVDVASNGQEALDALDLARHSVVLMDMHMAVMDGYEATRKIRERGAPVPIIAVTASAPDHVESWLQINQLDALVVKPYEPTELLRVIQKQLRRRHV